MRTPVIATLTLGLALTACYTDRSTEVARTETLPHNIHSRIREQIGDAEIVHIDRARRIGNWVYNVTYLQDGSRQSLEVRQDGAVLSRTEPEVIDEAAGAIVLPEND